MALRVVIHLVAGNLTEAVLGEVRTADLELAKAKTRQAPGTGIDWSKVGTSLGKSAGGIARMAGGMMRLAPQMILLTIGEWLLEGVLLKMQTPEGKGVADAVAAVGDVVLDLALKILPVLLDHWERVIGIMVPVLMQMLVIVHLVWPVIGPALGLQWQVFMVWIDLNLKIWEGLVGLATFVSGVVTYVTDALTAAGTTFGRIIADLPGAFARLLSDILSLVLGPLQAAMDAVSTAWDDFLDLYAAWMRGTNTYWANGRAWPVGTGPFPGALPGWSYVAPNDRQIRDSLARWVTDNGGARALDRRLRAGAA